MEFGNKGSGQGEPNKDCTLSSEHFLKLEFNIDPKKALKKLGKMEKWVLIQNLYKHSHTGPIPSSRVDTLHMRLISRLHLTDADLQRLIVSEEKPKNLDEEEFTHINKLWSASKFLAVKALALSQCPPDIAASFDSHPEAGHLQGEEFDKAMKLIEDWGKSPRYINEPFQISLIEPQVTKVIGRVTDLVDFYNTKKPVKDIYRLGPEIWNKYSSEDLDIEEERLLLIGNHIGLFGSRIQAIRFINKYNLNKSDEFYNYRKSVRGDRY